MAQQRKTRRKGSSAAGAAQGGLSASRRSTLPYVTVSDECGNIFEIPELRMVGMTGSHVVVPDPEELVALPPGSDLFVLPGRTALGYDMARDEVVEVTEYQGQTVRPVAGFMAPAYLQIARTAYGTLPGAPRLPLYSYTAVGWKRGRFYAAGMRIDRDQRQDMCHFDEKAIERNAQDMRRRYRGNRLVRHLVDNCVLRYRCPAARNFVMGRWECPIPTSRACNAACLGCISKQPRESDVVASHERICFTPTVEEIVEFTIPHLEHASRPVVSFGQGCEGEPLLNSGLIEEAIRRIRHRTKRGIININTNASKPAAIERLCRAGLDSIRVSLNSARPAFYEAYYKPRGYSLDEVTESMRVMRRYGRWVSLNYLVFPGFTDTPAELKALRAMLDRCEVDMIQTRNLNIDPEWYMEELGISASRARPMGMRAWVKQLREKYPNIRLGYFNPPDVSSRPRRR